MINDRRVIEYFSKELTRRMNTDGLKGRDISTYCCISEENLVFVMPSIVLQVIF